MGQLLFTGEGWTGTGGVLGHGLLHGTDGWKEGRRHGMISCGMVGPVKFGASRNNTLALWSG